MNRKSSSKGKPVSAELQKQLTEIFNSLPVRVLSKSEVEYRNLVKYFTSVTEHINHQLSWFGVRLANPSHETETQKFKFRPNSDLSMPTETLAEIFVNEILIGFGSDNIKEFTVVELIPVPCDGELSVVFRGKWELKGEL